MGFIDDFKFFFGKRTQKQHDSLTREDYLKLELQMHQQQQNINTPQLSESEKKEWMKKLSIFEEEPYKQIHIWFSIEEGWCYISGGGKRQKLSFTDSLERIKNLCDIVLK